MSPCSLSTDMHCFVFSCCLFSFESIREKPGNKTHKKVSHSTVSIMEHHENIYFYQFLFVVILPNSALLVMSPNSAPECISEYIFFKIF